MGIVKNLKFINEELVEVRGKLERLENFMNSAEYETKTDKSQKELLAKKLELLRQYVSLINQQIKYDQNLLQDADEFHTHSYEELEKDYFSKK